jgi:hypothetical protein
MMQTMERTRQIGVTFLIFCASVIAVDVILVLLHASVGWLIGAGLLLTVPTVYRVIKLMDDVSIGSWLNRRKRRKDERRLPRPIH